MTDSKFGAVYEDSRFQDVLSFLETRIRLELIAIIRRFRLKGEVLFEVRKKTTASAYSKLQKKNIERQEDLGVKRTSIVEIIQDLVGARIVCFDDEVQKKIFEYILQVESMAIQKDGLEFYSAPFREYTLSKDIHEDLSESINRTKSSIISQEKLQKKEKVSNYESLHFFIKFDSKIDGYLLDDLTSIDNCESKGERIRDIAERKYLQKLIKEFDEEQKYLISKIPVEVQVRTITQHLWAQEEHKYVYKNHLLEEENPNHTRAISVLSSTFTGLKFAYYNVERLRSIIKNVSSSDGKLSPVYRGKSKDLNSFRFSYFDDEDQKIIDKFTEVDGFFQTTNRLFFDENVGKETIAEKLIFLFDLVKDNSTTTSLDFDPEGWAKRRIFYLFLAYIALFSTDKSLPPSVAKVLKKERDIVDFVGETAFETSISDAQRGTLKLASKLYERVATYDSVSRFLLKDSKDRKAKLFWDPLVGIRLASSFFLQGEFAGAREAISGVFSLGGGKNELTSWSELELSRDFSLPEILMRYSQYIAFDDFESDAKMIESFSEAENVFEAIFSININEFNPEYYRALAWYQTITGHMFTQGVIIPENITKYRKVCRSYLVEHIDSAKNSLISRKPEVLLAFIFLPSRSDRTKNAKEEIQNAYNDFSKTMKDHNSYPEIANKYLKQMAQKIRDRAMVRVGGRSNSTFLSYSTKDFELASQLVVELRNNGLDIKFDIEFEKDKLLAHQVEQALSDARCAILLITRSYLASSWAKEERYFLMEKSRRKELGLFVVRVDVSQDELFEKAPLLSSFLNFELDTCDVKKLANELSAEINRHMNSPTFQL